MTEAREQRLSAPRTAIGRRIVGIAGGLDEQGRWLDADIELDDGTVLKIGYVGDKRSSNVDPEREAIWGLALETIGAIEAVEAEVAAEDAKATDKRSDKP